MPIYTYEVLDDSGKVIEIYEAEQSLRDAPLSVHPITGEKMRKIVTAASVNTKYSHWSSQMDQKNLTNKGFTRYEKDKLTGKYFKTNEGRGPQELDPKNNCGHDHCDSS